MLNEIIFIIHSTIITGSALIALFLGPHALIAFICLQCILANIFVIKQTFLFGFTATCADAFTIGATLGLNLLQEYFGKEITKKAIWVNFFLLIFYLIVSQIHLIYIPASTDTMHQHFISIFSVMPRIIIASFSVYFFVQMLDCYLYGILKKIFHDKHIIMRNYCTVAFCQLVDTVLFSFFGLYGIVENIGHIIFISYAVKIMSIITASPLIGLSRKIYHLRK